MKTKSILLGVLFMVLYHIAFAQVGVGNTNPQAVLDISASNSTSPTSTDGLLIPRMSNFPSSPGASRDGMLIFYTGTAASGKGFYYWNHSIFNWTFLATDGKNTLDQAYDEGGAGAGSTITADNGVLTISGEDGLLVTGTFGSGDPITPYNPTTRARMFYNPRKAAFRAGYVTGVNWDDSNLGEYSTAFGFNTRASGDYAIAYGASSDASGFSSTAFGIGTVASGNFATAFGQSTEASGNYATAFGNNTVSTGDYAVAFGRNTVATGDYATAFGRYTEASGLSSTAFGTNSDATGQNAVAFGNATDATGDNSTAFGSVTEASGRYTTAFGFQNDAPSFAETTIGTYATTYTPLGVTNFNPNDKLFSIGNGTNGSNRSNALTIYKNGLMNINDEYNMPLTDGINGQVMTTDGSGNITFQNSSSAWTVVGSDIERQSGDVYIGNNTATNNNLYISNRIIDWDNTSYLLDPAGNNFVNEINFDAGLVTDPSIHFDADDTTGFYRPEVNAIGFTSNGIGRIQLTSRGQIEFLNTGGSIFLGLNSGENDNFVNRRNIGIGDYTLENNTTGSRNLAVGYQALSNNLDGFANVAVGYSTLLNNTSGRGNTAINYRALENNLDGQHNIAIGEQALLNNSSGNRNIALGLNALTSNNADYNIGIGDQSCGFLSTGTRNIGIGFFAQGRQTDGNDNIAIGDRAMDTSTDSSSNIAIGTEALTNITEGNNNVVIGHLALGDNVGVTPNVAHNNVVIGHEAGQNAEGDGNIYIGYQAGRNDGLANNHLYIENSSANSNNALIYGEFDNDILRFNANVGIGRLPATNALEVEGNASKATAGAFIANSDKRLKKNIQQISGDFALEKINQLNGVTYLWNDTQTGTQRPEGIQYGFIAQNIQKVFPEKVTEDNLGFLQTAYGDYDPIVIEAIKALHEKIKVLETENNSLKEKLNQIESLEKRLLSLEENTKNSSTN